MECVSLYRVTFHVHTQTRTHTHICVAKASNIVEIKINKYIQTYQSVINSTKVSELV